MRRYGGVDLGAGRPRLLPRSELGLTFMAVDANILARVVALLSARDMCRLAQTASRFTTKILLPLPNGAATAAGPAAAEEPTSIVDEGARLAVAERKPAQRARWPPRAEESWLRVHAQLERLERPPRFSFSFNYPSIELSDGGRVAHNIQLGSSSVICEQPLMQFGAHRARFKIVSGSCKRRPSSSVFHVAPLTLSKLELR